MIKNLHETAVRCENIQMGVTEKADRGRQQEEKQRKELETAHKAVDWEFKQRKSNVVIVETVKETTSVFTPVVWFVWLGPEGNVFIIYNIYLYCSLVLV